MSKTLYRRFKPFVRPLRRLPSLARIVFGSTLLLVGVLGLALPLLPGVVLIPLGLLMLSLDFAWARRGYVSFLLWLRRRSRARTK